MSSDPLREFFDSIDMNTVKEMVENNQEENINLEFKIVNNQNFNHRDDRKNLAKALSGFANSSGGIIIWGVEARKNSENIDCAINIKPIESLPLLLTRLNQFIGQAVSPIVDGVENRALTTENNNGIVVTYIPESFNGPYMAKLGEDRYYKRSGDSFYRMEHFDIADMFGRRKTSLLSVKYSISQAGSSKKSIVNYRNLGYRISLGLKNNGRGSARAPYVALNGDLLQPLRIGTPQNNFMNQLANIQEDRWYRFGANAGLVIHPGIQIEFIYFSGTFRSDLRKVEDITVEYQVTSEDQQMINNSFTIQSTEILEMY